MSDFTYTDVLVLRQIVTLCPGVELDGSTARFAEYMNDLADRIQNLAPPPFNPFEFKIDGVGEVIDRNDPRHPHHPEYTPLEPTSTTAPQTSRG